ncbi:MAG: anti-sigma factor [Saprospiraceae bacterium]|nr:anti-sigma factor [Saprospiraceae bacterium]
MMTLEQIRNSGLLEAFVIGDISQDDKMVVMDVIAKYPELKNDLAEIENALQLYASAHQVEPSENLKENILKQAKMSASTSSDDLKTPPGNSWYRYLWWMGWIALAAIFFWKNNQLNQLQAEYDQLRLACDSLQEIQDQQIRVFNDIRDENNQIFAVNATEKYPDTDLYLHVNATSNTNYIQIKNLPPINANQSYQLWSLKGDQAIPLDVFQGEGDNIFNVQFEPGTDAYAITIEPLGGQQTPTLDDLIGVIPLS